MQERIAAGSFNEHPADDLCVRELERALKAMTNRLRKELDGPIVAQMLEGRLEGEPLASALAALERAQLLDLVKSTIDYYRLVAEARIILLSAPYPTTPVIEAILDREAVKLDCGVLLEKHARSCTDEELANAHLARARRDRGRIKPSLVDEIISLATRNVDQEEGLTTSPAPSQASAPVIDAATDATAHAIKLIDFGYDVHGPITPEVWSVTADLDVVVITLSVVIDPTPASLLRHFVGNALKANNQERRVEVGHRSPDENG